MREPAKARDLEKCAEVSAPVSEVRKLRLFISIESFLWCLIESYGTVGQKMHAGEKVFARAKRSRKLRAFGIVRLRRT